MKNGDKENKFKKHNYNGPQCCLHMHNAVDKSNPNNVSPCRYTPNLRYYYVQTTNYAETSIGTWEEPIYFCPFCGTSLAKELRDEWYDTIAKELQLDPTDSHNTKLIPKEFLTDKWWKKRGL